MATCPGQKVHCTVKNKFRSEKKVQVRKYGQKKFRSAKSRTESTVKKIRSEKVQVRKYSQTSFRSEITVRKKFRSYKIQVRKHSQKRLRSENTVKKSPGTYSQRNVTLY